MGVLLEKELRDKIEPALGIRSWRVNPLEAIGLNTDLLAIGIPAPELFRAVKSYVRQLAAIVHPDMGSTTIDAARAQEIRSAFETLQEYGDFQSALSRLIQGQDEGVRELKQLKILIGLQRNYIAKLERAVSEGKLNRQNIESLRGHLARQEADFLLRDSRIRSKQSEFERAHNRAKKLSLQVRRAQNAAGELEAMIRSFLLNLPPVEFSGRLELPTRKASISKVVVAGRVAVELRREEDRSKQRWFVVIGSAASDAAKGGPINIMRSGFVPALDVGRRLVMLSPSRKSIQVYGEIVRMKRETF